jgi:MarC family integral membrane protein
MEAQMTTLSAGILLFLIMDPLGNIPLFLALLKDVPPQRRRKVMVRELLIALAVLIGFLLGGQYILKVLQLRQESVSIGGGIVLFLIGIRMVFPPVEGGVFGHGGIAAADQFPARPHGGVGYRPVPGVAGHRDHPAELHLPVQMAGRECSHRA